MKPKTHESIQKALGAFETALQGLAKASVDDGNYDELEEVIEVIRDVKDTVDGISVDDDEDDDDDLGSDDDDDEDED